MTITRISERIAALKEFGDIPAYAVIVTGRRIHICRNNGQAHPGTALHEGRPLPGWATYLGSYTRREALDFLRDERRSKRGTSPVAEYCSA